MHCFFSHFMSPELWLFFCIYDSVCVCIDVCVFFVNEMVISIGGCKHKEFIHRRCMHILFIESLFSLASFLAQQCTFQFIHPFFYFYFCFCFDVYAFDFLLLLLVLKFCRLPFWPYMHSFWHIKAIWIRSAFFYLLFVLQSTLSALHYFSFLPALLVCVYYLVYFFLLLYLEFWCASLFNAALHSFSSFFFPPSKSFFVCYHSIVNVTYTCVSKMCWCIFIFASVSTT